MPLVEIKYVNAIIDNTPFFDQPVKNKQEAYEKHVEVSRNDGCTTGNLLDYLYHQNYHKFIGLDLLIQTNTTVPQQINLTGKLEDVAIMFFIAEKQQKTISNSNLDSLIKTEYKQWNIKKCWYYQIKQAILNL